MRKEVRSSTAPLVDVPVHHTARCSSPEFPCRAAEPSACAAASPPRPPPLGVSPSHAPHVDATHASNRAPEPKFEFAGELRRRSLSATAARRRSALTRVLGRRIEIQRTRSKPAAPPPADDASRRIQIRRISQPASPASRHSHWI
jgi:hypothetical protein